MNTGKIFSLRGAFSSRAIFAVTSYIVFVAIALLIPLFVAMPTAPAQAYQWNAGAGSWFDSRNWLERDVPSWGDDVIISDSFAQVAIEDGAAESGSLHLNRGHLTIEVGGTLTSAGMYHNVGWNVDPGAMRITGANSRWNVEASGIGIRIGRSSEGTLVLDDGGMLSVSGDANRLILGEHVDLNATPGRGTLIIGALIGGAAIAPGFVSTDEIEMGRGDDGDGSKAWGRIVFNHTDTTGNYEFAPDITGTGSVEHESGHTVLIGTNDYTGPTVVNGGILQAGGADAFVQGGAYVVNDGSLQINGYNLTMSSLSGDGGTVLLGRLPRAVDVVTLTIDQDVDTTFRGDINGPAHVLSDGFVTLVKDGSGTLTLTGSGTLNNFYTNGGLRVRGGELALAEGGTLRATWLILGAENRDSMLRVAGADSRWQGGGSIDVGSVGGNAQISIEDGGTLNSALYASIAYLEDSKGSVTLSGTSLWEHTGGNFTVGSRGEGVLTILEGSQVRSGTSRVGRDAGAQGTVVVDGFGSVWSTSGNVFVGDAAGSRGEVRIANGGQVDLGGALLVGNFAGALGRVTVTGGESALMANEVHIGHQGQGELSVIDGGGGAGSLIVGNSVDAVGSAVIAGTGTEWNVSDSVIVGAQGEGTLTVADGAILHSEVSGASQNFRITVAQNAGSSGTLRIGDGGATGVVAASTVTFGEGDGTLVFDHTDTDYSFDAVLASDSEGRGQVRHLSGVTRLTGDSSPFRGQTNVKGGTLLVGGLLGGSLTVEDGATLGGSGTVGSTLVMNGATLAAGNSIGTLTVDGDLFLSSGSFLDYQLGGPGTSDDPAVGRSGRIVVTGDLTLDGKLNLFQSGDPVDGTVGLGYYRLVTYDGTLTDNGLEIGSAPEVEGGRHRVLTGDGRVDLFIAAVGDDTLQHWQGGDGVWNAAGERWRNADGEVDVAWAGNYAVFRHEPGGFAGGTITVEGMQMVQGLQFVDDGYMLAGNGALLTAADGSEIRVLAGSAEIATEITGVGGIVKTEAGTLILSGTNTYTGGTTLHGGTLQVATDDNLGHASGGLVFAGGTLRVADSMATGRNVTLERTGVIDVIDSGGPTGHALELLGRISGSGALHKTGAGELVLANTDNDYSGGTVVSEGVVNVMAGGALGTGPVMVGGGATVDVSGSYAGVSIGSLSGDGEVILGDNTLTLGALSYDDTFDGEITDHGLGGGLVKTGAGTLTLTGDQSYTGATDINEGRLQVDGSIALSSLVTVRGGSRLHVVGTVGETSIEAGGTLSGIGTVGTTTVQNGGILAAGSSVGTLTVNGDLALKSGSVVEIEVHPETGESDLIQVTGTAVLEGGSVVHVGAAGNYKPLAMYRILTADGGVTGTFSDVTSDFAFLTPSLLYDEDTVSLRLARNDIDFTMHVTTRNQRAAAEGADSLGVGHGVYDAILMLPDDEHVIRSSLDLISGEIHASVKGFLLSEGHMIRRAILSRLRHSTLNGIPRVSEVAADRLGSTGNLGELDVRDWGLFIADRSAYQGDGNAATMKQSTTGFVVGTDKYSFNDWAVGLVIGHSRSSFDVADRASSGSNSNVQFGLYAGKDLGDMAVRTGLIYGHHGILTSRTVTAGTLREDLSARYAGITSQAFGELGYRFHGDTVSYEPFVLFEHAVISTEGFTEEGGDAALYADSQMTALRSATLGLRVLSAFHLGNTQLTAGGFIGWSHAFGDWMMTSRHAMAGGDDFIVVGVPSAGSGAHIEAGLELDLSAGVSLGLTYSGRLLSDFHDQAVHAQLAIKF